MKCSILFTVLFAVITFPVIILHAKTPPTMPATVKAYESGNKSVLHESGFKIISDSVGEVARLEQLSFTTIKSVTPEASSIAKHVEVVPSGDIISIVKRTIVENQLPVLEVQALGKTYMIVTDKFESTGLASGVFIGKIENDDFSLVTISYCDEDFTITMCPSNENTVILSKAATLNAAYATEFNDKGTMSVCGFTTAE